MTLEEKDKLITDLIRENKEATIQDYLDTVEEIEGIKPLPTLQKAIFIYERRYEND